MAIFKEFPIGEPDIVVGESAEEVRCTAHGVYYKGKAIHGVLQVTIRPPDSLNIPVLPKLSKSKLMFGLCSTCMDERKDPPCKHDDSKRDLLDTWTTVEVCYAISKGYKVVRVWEAFYYTTLAPIFKSFYTKLARIKLESEGWPAYANTSAERSAYIADVNRRMPGLGLEAKNVERNEARRQFAKGVSNIGLGETEREIEKCGTLNRRLSTILTQAKCPSPT